jgi:hypothetical protein
VTWLATTEELATWLATAEGLVTWLELVMAIRLLLGDGESLVVKF